MAKGLYPEHKGYLQISKKRTTQWKSGETEWLKYHKRMRNWPLYTWNGTTSSQIRVTQIYNEVKPKVSQSHPKGLSSPWGSPGRILEWAAFPFSRGSSQPRDQTQVSGTVGGFFTSWATREAPIMKYHHANTIMNTM